MKRFQLIRLLVAAIAVCATAVAFATNLAPPADNPSGASGKAATTYDGPYRTQVLPGVYWYGWDAVTTFSVRGLEAGTPYRFVAINDTDGAERYYDFTTDGRGSYADYFYWKIVHSTRKFSRSNSYWVYSVNADGTTGILVLSGR
jgi:hypothetical protein